MLAVKVQENQVLYTRNGKTLARSLVPPGVPLRAAAYFTYLWYGGQGEQREHLGSGAAREGDFSHWMKTLSAAQTYVVNVDTIHGG